MGDLGMRISGRLSIRNPKSAFRNQKNGGLVKFA